MINYKDTIYKVLVDLYGHESFYFVDDPNEKIDSILKNEEINWYPPYLVFCEDKFFMFMPFCYENFIDESEVKEECKNARHLVDCLKNEGEISKVFFITNANEDVEALELQKLSNDFGILHNELDKPLLDFSVTNSFNLKCKLLPHILKYLADCENLKGKIGDLVRSFSKEYIEIKPEGNNENEMIKKFMEQILTCDERFKLDTDPINFMSEIEKIATNPEDRIRDHFFHAFNTMMLGFMIIDKLYERFDTLAKKYGDDIILEYIWILTSLYHDIGYPVLLQPFLFCQTYGLEEENNSALIDGCVKQNRQEFWNSTEYCFIVEVLNHLFDHITNNKGEKWVFDGFPHPAHSTKFKNNIKTSFIEEGAHGTAGALRLALLTNKQIRDIEGNKDREFIYRHVMLASISILFHDLKVRDCFRKNSIKNIRAENFPFSILLTYVDILQDDRRDSTGSSSRPDIFKDIKILNKKTIVATLEEEILVSSTRKKIFEELEEALSFFIMDELVFAIPEELLIIKP
ncbi:MAG: hypothetical protein IMZ60_02290 [Actinobacteria bacterium]|nr:hypothetical protein [Actinomycetota bacterium]